MRTILVVLVALIGLSLAADLINFNSNDYCEKNKKYKKQVSSDEILNLEFKPQSDNFGASLNNFFDTLEEDCEMRFWTLSFTEPRLQVRFDSMDRMINEDRVKLEFYDSDGVKFSKLIREVSKDKPLRSNDTITTTGSFLTIKGFRDIKKSKNYKVAMNIRTVSSAQAVQWSLMAALIAMVTQVIV